MKTNLTLLLLISSVILNIIVIGSLCLLYGKHRALKRRYLFLSSEFDVLSASYYLKKKDAIEKPSSNGTLVAKS
jgi:hypothetical protein